MEQETKSVEDFNFQLISDFYKQIDRQGPGSVEVTKRALNFTDNLSASSKIADIGCGTGGQTLTLAQNTEGSITAIDLLPDFIEVLKQKAEKAGFGNRISTIVENMNNLPFSEDELDLIWAEGSIYLIGFEKGLNDWNKYLKKNGFIAVSEVTWLTEERPAEIQEFWDRNYPKIDTISNKIRIMEKAGYKATAHFILPENCWLENFYNLMPEYMEKFLKRYNYRDEAKQFIESQQAEIDLYNKYKYYYSYVFYIGQKI